MKTRKIFEHFEPYTWETPTREIAARVGLSPRKIVRLDTNTSPFLPTHSLKVLARKLAGVRVNEYPDTSYLRLRKLLASYCKMGVRRFVVTNGADEGLDIIAKTFLEPGDEAIIASPTYSMFRITTEIMGGKLISVPRDKDFGVNIEGILRSAGNRTKVIFLCNPNNPTGDATPIDDVETIAERTDATIAIDEAYFEFCGMTSAKLTGRHPNIIIVRTFSKAFSMAGVRVGYLIAAEETIEELNKVRPPNSVTVISLELAQHALSNPQEMRMNVRAIVSERERCFEALNGLKEIEAYPSEANFILFKVKKGDANKLHRRLMRRGFVLRNFADASPIKNSLRFTIGTGQVNDAFLRLLKASL